MILHIIGTLKNSFVRKGLQVVNQEIIMTHNKTNVYHVQLIWHIVQNAKLKIIALNV